MDALEIHIDSGECGAMPEREDQCMIYDRRLIMDLLPSEPFENLETLVIGWIAEKAIELGKVEAWGPLAEWRKLTVLVNTFAVEKRDEIDEMRAEQSSIMGFVL